ncbi:hypothetical protein FVEG_01692 [Fusarium verticillioides 7600]|uniref:Uncharacterized protein n=1 Tax=Gibberella moniliformis (strain M3125 / FGSC 7600) TaxID=334819 RepID=W7LSP4_GIBM7|nr:hypothetical protein FVEG_01692 [Fusarium verticillioides 7600]EWG38490.1 hypothetical protein FVEG_01692 [Fusarium verticillioides 7600]
MGETASYTPSASTPAPPRRRGDFRSMKSREAGAGSNFEGKNLGQRDTRLYCGLDRTYGVGLLLLYRDTCAGILSVRSKGRQSTRVLALYPIKRRKKKAKTADSGSKVPKTMNIKSREASARSKSEGEQVSEHRQRQMTPSRSNDLVIYPLQGGRTLPYRNTFMCEHLE